MRCEETSTSTCTKWWVSFIPRVRRYDFESYSATLGLLCTRIPKTRDWECNVTLKRSIAPNLHAARDSHPSQFATLSLLDHPAQSSQHPLGTNQRLSSLNHSYLVIVRADLYLSVGLYHLLLYQACPELRTESLNCSNLLYMATVMTACC